MSGISAPITFIREIEGSKKDLTVPKEFVKDFYFFSEEHLMIMLRILGTDSNKVIDFFKDCEENSITIKTIKTQHEEEISDRFILKSVYMDEGPPLSVDIDQELSMARIIPDFQVE